MRVSDMPGQLIRTGCPVALLGAQNPVTEAAIGRDALARQRRTVAKSLTPGQLPKPSAWRGLVSMARRSSQGPISYRPENARTCLSRQGGASRQRDFE